MTAVDASAVLVDAAATADPSNRYLVASAEDLPFDAATFDLVVAYNSLMDVEDMPAAVREAARVLEPGRRMAICVTHPIADAGRFVASADAPEAFVIADTYLGARRYEGVYQRDGVSMDFSGWAYDLETYFAAFESAGFVVERLMEPTPSPLRDAKWARVPMFLMLRCRLLA